MPDCKSNKPTLKIDNVAQEEINLLIEQIL